MDEALEPILAYIDEAGGVRDFEGSAFHLDHVAVDHELQQPRVAEGAQDTDCVAQGDAVPDLLLCRRRFRHLPHER